LLRARQQCPQELRLLLHYSKLARPRAASAGLVRWAVRHLLLEKQAAMCFLLQLQVHRSQKGEGRVLLRRGPTQSALLAARQEHSFHPDQQG
jgi:hypothetical protein